jgi:hypothetical protein
MEGWLRQTYAHLRESDAKGEQIWTMYAAWIAVRIGENAQALKWLEKGRDEKASFMLYVNVDPIWEPLRSDPRFVRFNEKVDSFSP